MTPCPSAFSMSQRECVDHESVPQILSAAWSVCTPSDVPLVDQLNNVEKTFLINLAEYILTALDSPLSASDPATVLSDILMTTRHRLSSLHKETTLSPHFVAVSAVLHLLANLFSSDNMKYTSTDQFLNIYPDFGERPEDEIENLFHTANWMHILFQITTAKKNKGMVMIVIPKFIEGNSAQYVTGSGQTQPTKDRVAIYEHEGNVKPVRRSQRKTRQEMLEDEEEVEKPVASKRRSATAKRKSTYEKRGRPKLNAPVVVKRSVKNSHSPFKSQVTQQTFVKLTNDPEPQNLPHLHRMASDVEPFTSVEGSGFQNYLPLPLSFSMAPPIPVRRSQSSFSQAAAAIASFNQNVVKNAADYEDVSKDSVYVCSPRECYLDIEANGAMKKTTPSDSAATSSSFIFDAASTQGCTTENLNGNDQLQMLREVSEDSDISTDTGNRESVMPSFLLQPNAQSFLMKTPSSSSLSGLDSPIKQPPNVERCSTSTLDESEMNFELLEALSRQASQSWLSRSTSASSLSGRESSLSLRA